MMDEVLIVLTNLPDRDSAHKLAHQLVESRTTACVNILAECTSIYRWQGKIENASEVPLLIKTTRAAYHGLEAMIRSHHPYELPEIIAVSVDAGLPAYLQWVAEEVSIMSPPITNVATKE
jgi:periplasmic divalent cation tolerance protein